VILTAVFLGQWQVDAAMTVGLAQEQRQSDGAIDAGHHDVVIVGAGISGIGAARQLRVTRPGERFMVLESQDGFGGTWRTHRYPGARSDSDLYTFGYVFKPWVGKPYATAPEILAYLAAVIEEYELGPAIRYGCRVVAASWSSDTRRWTLDVDRVTGSAPASERLRLTADFLWMCQGYYRHASGYAPQWPGMADFGGPIIHPQTWPDDLQTAGKRIVVIGSGATAATLVPALASSAEHVTILQRSPTFYIPNRNANALADMLRELQVDGGWIHEIVRRKILFDQAVFIRRARAEPDAVRAELIDGVRAQLGPDAEIEPHFSPLYRPWRQRIAVVPDGDLFQAIRSGKAAMVTDAIERFEPHGLRLASGRMLPADIVITATGFHLSVLGDIAFEVDRVPLDFARTITWRGMMFTGVPNLAWVFGYFRASWTLRSDLVAGIVCRLRQRMAERGASMVVPTLRPDEQAMTLAAWVDPENFNPGYLMRDLHRLPRQGDRQPWLHTQDYWADKDQLPSAPIDDGSLRFS
jgi:cation diffusion facilitator CzcD-associated flavoprotein CzcO